ncbi:hypothetical protein FOA43_003585 [Brettanomyces nanus]|uniref:Guanine nucleotide-exchange factor SEC12 n=1 Tax=Eeniella nana TaxID=13502 RepID=A0A875S967_EENNA|nr:uncharacterized protein FOA43_003585 [Brettanomyces nanus]QPG76199.1 hypothetical protein FOA43_003585 [Brettanomyces nanus]
MAKLKGYSLDVGYPVYGAKFVGDKTLIVVGGGGEGKNGVPNKITALLVQPDHPKKPIKRYRELVLNDQEDCPMSMDVNSNVILLGANENSEMIKKGVNKHLRKFKFVNDHLKFVESCQIHPGSNPQHYQKITCLSRDGSLGVISMSDNPSSVYIVDTSEDLEERFKIVTPGDVKDIGISPDGKMMCYLTSSHLEAISTITGRSVFKTDIKFQMSKVGFYDNNILVLAGSQKNGITLALFSIAKSAIVKESVICKNLKGVTSMDVNSNSGLISLSGSDCSLLLVRFKDFKLLRKVNQVHNFAITKVTSSSDGHYLASVSAANTVSVLVTPPKFAESKSLFLSLFEFFLSIVCIALLAICSQYLYANGYIALAKEKLVQFYESRRPADSSSYFTIQPMESSETFLSGPPSTTTYLPEDATVKSDIISFSSEPSVTTVTPITSIVSSSIEISLDTPVSLVDREVERKDIYESRVDSKTESSFELASKIETKPETQYTSDSDSGSAPDVSVSEVESKLKLTQQLLSSCTSRSLAKSTIVLSALSKSKSAVVTPLTSTVLSTTSDNNEISEDTLEHLTVPEIVSHLDSLASTASRPLATSSVADISASVIVTSSPSSSPLVSSSEISLPSPSLSPTPAVPELSVSPDIDIVIPSNSIHELLQPSEESMSVSDPELQHIEKETTSFSSKKTVTDTVKQTVKETVIEIQTSVVTQISVQIATATETSTIVEHVTVTHSESGSSVKTETTELLDESFEIPHSGDQIDPSKILEKPAISATDKPRKESDLPGNPETIDVPVASDLLEVDVEAESFIVRSDSSISEIFETSLLDDHTDSVSELRTSTSETAMNVKESSSVSFGSSTISSVSEFRVESLTSDVSLSTSISSETSKSPI